MTRPTVLFVSPRVPYPLTDGSAFRQYHILRGYCRVASVKLLTFFQDPEELHGEAFLATQGVELLALPLSTAAGFRLGSLWRRRMQQLATRRPLLADAFLSQEMRAAVNRLSPSVSLIHAYRLGVAPNLEPALRENPRRRKFVLDLDDVETVTRRRALRLAPARTWRRRLFERVDLLRLAHYQAAVLARSDRFFVCSRRDQARFPGDKAVVVPNGATVPAAPLPESQDERVILAVGLLSYEPNVDALRFFVRDVLPIIRSTLPNTHLLIVGKNPGPEVLALQDRPIIEVAANVPDMEPYYRRATISIVPLRSGGGTRLRILESFALGRAVVSTSIGCEGLEALDGEHLLVADAPQPFAEACVRLLSHSDDRRRLVTNARQLVAEHYSWDRVEQQVAGIAGALLGKPQ
jgi:glycosyltransferase involved in cell wall biosynthesis